MWYFESKMKFGVRESLASELGQNLLAERRKEVIRAATLNAAETDEIYGSPKPQWGRQKHPKINVTWAGGEMRLPMDE